MATPCFWVERTDESDVSLRRYTRKAECGIVPLGWTGPRNYHNASVSVGRSPTRYTERRTVVASIDGSVADDDPRWPSRCACGYAFVGDDYRQVNQEPVYRAADGREWLQRNLPPGALLDACWVPDNWKGPDGLAVTAVLPEGPYVEGETDTRGWWWNVDGPATEPTIDGGTMLVLHAWTRTGSPTSSPPTVSATPSINAHGRYHGFLTNGVLT